MPLGSKSNVSLLGSTPKGQIAKLRQKNYDTAIFKTNNLTKYMLKNPSIELIETIQPATAE